MEQDPARFDIDDRFEGDGRSIRFMTPYHDQGEDWIDASYDGELRIYGRDSLFSQMNPSVMATPATSFEYTLQTKVSFAPVHYSQGAGVGLYYDNNNWLYARLCCSDDEKSCVLRVLQARLGARIEHKAHEVEVPSGTAEIRIDYSYGSATVLYRLEEQDSWVQLCDPFDVEYLSDEGVNGEPGEIGGFTALFNFIGAVDSFQHESYGSFSYYTVTNTSSR